MDTSRINSSEEKTRKNLPACEITSSIKNSLELNRKIGKGVCTLETLEEDLGHIGGFWPIRGVI